MNRRKSTASDASICTTSDSYAFDCELIQPLGYTTYRPLNGRSVDQELFDSVKALGLRSGDRVTITVVRASQEVK